ncbi:MAG: CBS domain-containing protein [Deltaproteobacteria bacterium]|jgi:CBS-domain-containing membrane protein
MIRKTRVKDLMIPRSEYATVPSSATLLEAMRALESENRMHGDSPYRHRAVLVLNDEGVVVGKVSQVDMMRALEPNYQKMGTDIDLSRFGFSSAFISAAVKQFHLWERPLKEIRESLKKIKVVDVMYTPADHQRVKESDSLTMAIHQIVMGRHQSLLVTRGKRVVGILRSTDVFNALYNQMEMDKPS